MRSNQLLKNVSGLVTGLVLALSANAADLTGAGATFPYPIYSKWAEAYKAATGIGLINRSVRAVVFVKSKLKRLISAHPICH